MFHEISVRSFGYKERKTKEVLFLVLGYQRLLTRFSVGSRMNLRKKKEKITGAQVKLMERVEGYEERKISWSCTCVHVSWWQFKTSGREGEETVVE